MSLMNRLHTSLNPHQGTYKKVLCVCSAGLLRSPTAALVLAQEPFNFNTRACGIHDYALVIIDDVLMNWADEIVVMEQYMVKSISIEGKPIIVLGIKDEYAYRDKKLQDLIKKYYLDATSGK